MGITYGDHLIDIGHHDITPEQEREIEGFYDDDVECWNCGGEGFIASCFEEYACVDPESGCDECMRTCDVCEGKGHFPRGGDDAS